MNKSVGRRGVSATLNDNRRKDYEARTPFQEYTKPLLDANRLVGKSPSSYQELHESLIMRSFDVSLNHVYKVIRGDPEKDLSVRRPGYDLAVAIGEILGDLTGALKAAGYDESEPKTTLVLPQPNREKGREVSADTLQIVAAYEGLPPGPLRQEAREYIKGLQEVAQRAYSRRTDIIGKTDHDAEGDLERTPDRG